MVFTKDSILVKTWVRFSGRRNIYPGAGPKLFNLKSVVSEV